MLGLGLSLPEVAVRPGGGGEAGPPAWAPPGALMALEFDEGRYWINGLGLLDPDELRFNRDSEAYFYSLTSATGDVTQAGDDEPCIAGNGLLLRSTTAAQSLPDPADLSLWSNSGTPTVTDSGQVYSGMTGWTIATATAGHRRFKTITGGWSNGVARHYLVIWQAGTANQIRVTMRNDSGATSSTLQGAPGSVASSTTAAGSFSNVSEAVLSGSVRLLRFTFTPNADAANTNIGVGTGATSGTVIVFGANRWDTIGQEFAKAATTRTAEIVGPPLATGTYDLLVADTSSEWRDDVAWAREYVVDPGDVIDPAEYPDLYSLLAPRSGQDRIRRAYAYAAGLTPEQKTAAESYL